MMPEQLLINASPPSRLQQWHRVGFAVLLLIAVFVRSIDVWRPVDGSMFDPVRETDVAGIARNYYEEGMNLFLPRIDWRGDGPGFTESEFPLFPWIGACLYQVFGYHEELLRIEALLLSVATCALFFKLASEKLRPIGALAASGIFALNPMSVRMGSSIQPEPLMFCAYVAAGYFFLHWCEQQRRRDYWLALVATAVAILAKLPAIHIGVLFACLCFQHFGWRAVMRRDVWLFAILAVGVPIGWYVYARSLWVAYGNSLGMSNEAYLRIGSGNFLQTLRDTLPGNVETELFWIWTIGGAVLGVFGLPRAFRKPQQRWIAFWAGTLAVYYVVSGRTTGESWAVHYHIVSLPVAALLIGKAVVGIEERINALLEGVPMTRFRRWTLSGACAVGYLVMFVTVMDQVRHTRWFLRPNLYWGIYDSAMQFKPYIEPGSLIVASGALEKDQYGLPRAYNTPYYFYWTHSKGFTLGDSDQHVAKLAELRGRGAKYFVCERKSLKNAPGFEDELRTHFRVLSENDLALLVDLREHAAEIASGAD